MADLSQWLEQDDHAAPLAQALRMLPQFCARIALVAPDSESCRQALAELGREIHWFVMGDSTATAPCLSADLLLAPAPLPIPSASLNAVVLDLRTADLQTASAMLRRLIPCTTRYARVFLLADRNMPWAGVQSVLDACSLVRYVAWLHNRMHFVCTEACFNTDIPLAPEEALVVEDSFDTCPAPCWLISATRKKFDSLEHAASLIPFPAPENGLMVLHGTPIRLLTPPDRFAKACLLAQLAHLAWDSLDASQHVLNHFARAQRHFYLSAALQSDMLECYQTQASFWSRLGRPDMAAGLIRTANAYRGEPFSIEPAEPPQSDITPPPLSAENRFRRVLFLTSPYVDYGPDTLFDGLRRVLGDDGVVEYPWKSTLHGGDPAIAKTYPCTFNYPGDPLSEQEIIGQIRDGRFDGVIFADIVTAGGEVHRRVLEAARDLPAFILDMGDECGCYWNSILQFMGRTEVSGCFKREMLIGSNYGPLARPLPFAYPEDRLTVDIQRPSWNQQRTRPLFWAGNRNIGLRRTFLEPVENALGMPLDAEFTQEEYLTVLRQSRICLCLFGLGFDTVRYWEAAAQGAMLLANRPPIHIPHNFVDGQSAVFFDDLPDLLAKLGYYLAHPAESLAIADAGHALLCEHHTTRARASQLLAWMNNA